MSKLVLKLQAAAAGLAVAMVLAGCEFVDPVLAQAASAPQATEVESPYPDHP